MDFMGLGRRVLKYDDRQNIFNKRRFQTPNSISKYRHYFGPSEPEIISFIYMFGDYRRFSEKEK